MRDSRLSLTIDHDTSELIAISELSMAACVYLVNNPAEAGRAMKLLSQRYPEYASFPVPKLEEIRIFRVKPKVNLGARLLEGVWSHGSRDSMKASSQELTYIGGVSSHPVFQVGSC
jgi:hypothetical protein